MQLPGRHDPGIHIVWNINKLPDVLLQLPGEIIRMNHRNIVVVVVGIVDISHIRVDLVNRILRVRDDRDVLREAVSVVAGPPLSRQAVK